MKSFLRCRGGVCFSGTLRLSSLLGWNRACLEQDAVGVSGRTSNAKMRSPVRPARRACHAWYAPRVSSANGSRREMTHGVRMCEKTLEWSRQNPDVVGVGAGRCYRSNTGRDPRVESASRVSSAWLFALISSFVPFELLAILRSGTMTGTRDERVGVQF